jgi:hypothetical protein
MASIWIPPVACHSYNERNPASGDRTSTVAVVFLSGGINRSLLLETNRLSVCPMMDPILDILQSTPICLPGQML